MYPLDARIVVEIFRAANLLAKAGNRLAGALGLTQQQWVLLAAIARGKREGLPLSVLGRNLLVTKANITGMVDRLERDGYVAREAHPSDRRVTRARLTPRGRSFLAAIAPRQAAWSARNVSARSPRISQITRRLQRRPSRSSRTMIGRPGFEPRTGFTIYFTPLRHFL